MMEKSEGNEHPTGSLALLREVGKPLSAFSVQSDIRPTILAFQLLTGL